MEIRITWRFPISITQKRADIIKEFIEDLKKINRDDFDEMEVS